MEGPQRQESSWCCKYWVHEDCQKGAELVVYDNVTNDVYMQDLVMVVQTLSSMITIW